MSDSPDNKCALGFLVGGVYAEISMKKGEKGLPAGRMMEFAVKRCFRGLVGQ